MKPYPDSNFIAHYFLEPDALGEKLAQCIGKQWIHAELPVFWLHRFEVSNAFLAYAFRAASGGEPRVSTEWALSLRGKFLDVMKAETQPFLQVALSPSELWAQFDELSLRHTSEHGYRTYDLLHVSAALLLNSGAFWSFDAKACDLAQREGLKVL